MLPSCFLFFDSVNPQGCVALRGASTGGGNHNGETDATRLAAELDHPKGTRHPILLGFGKTLRSS